MGKSQIIPQIFHENECENAFSVESRDSDIYAVYLRLGSRVVSVLDSVAERQITAATLSGNSLRQTVHTHRASVHQAAKLVAALLRVNCEGNCRPGGK